MDTFIYEPIGVCSKLIQVKIQDGVIYDVAFTGGCNGNLKGISSLCRMEKVDDVIKKLQGIPCGMKSTSCPDQLAQCLIQYNLEKQSKKENVL